MITRSAAFSASHLRLSLPLHRLGSCKALPRRCKASKAPASMAISMIKADELETGLSKLQNGYVHFRAEWCPDCLRSNDAVLKAVTSAGHDVLVVDVGDRPTWKNPANPLRSDPRFKLSGVPTLVHWKAGQLGAKLGTELERAPTTAAAQQAVEKFVASQSN